MDEPMMNSNPPTIEDLSAAADPPSAADSASPSAPRKKHTGRWILLTLCILLTLALIAGGLFAYWYTRPETVLKGAVSNYLESFILDNNPVDCIMGASQNGKIHLSVEAGDLSEKDVAMDIYQNVREGKAVLQWTQDTDTLGWYVTPDQWLLTGMWAGDDVLSVEPVGLYEQFESSVFAPSSKSSVSIGLDSDELKALSELFEEMEKAFLPIEERDEVDYGEKYLNLIIDLLDEHSTPSVNTEDGVQTNTYVFTADQLIAWVDAIAEELILDVKELNLDNMEFDLSAQGVSEPVCTSRMISIYRNKIKKSIQELKKNGQTVTLTVCSKVIPHMLQSVTVAVSPAESVFVEAPTYHWTVNDDRSSVLVRTNQKNEEEMRMTLEIQEGTWHLYVDELNALKRMERVLELTFSYAEGESYEIGYNVNTSQLQTTLSISGKILEDTKDAFVFTVDQMKVTAASGDKSAEKELDYGMTVGFYPNAELPDYPKATGNLFELTILEAKNLEQNSGYTVKALEAFLKAYLDEYAKK